MNSFSKTIAALFFALLMVSCIGPEGPIGPEGGANITTVVFKNVSFFNNELAGVYQVFLDTDELTDEIIANGDVSAFIAKANSDNSEWTALPGNFSPVFEDDTQSRFFDFNFAKSRAVVYSSVDPGYNVDIKLVIVSGE